MIYGIKAIILLFITILSATCANKRENYPDENTHIDEQPYATAWITALDGSRTFEKMNVSMGYAVQSSFTVRFTGKEHQQVNGFGAAITQASCYNLLKMDKTDRTRLLKEMFSPVEGAGSSLIRVCIGGSDFSLDEFTHCDTEGIDNFEIHRLDKEYLFPVLDEIYAINPDVKIIGSPWSCPKWMKCRMPGGSDSFNLDVTEEIEYNSWTGGRLRPSCYDDYAEYFVRWIKAMEERGYNIFAVTPQNEPLHGGNSMSLIMPWKDQRNFIKVLGPAFRKAGIKTKILAFDHNYDYDEIESQELYPLKIYADKEASEYIAGSAWHNYGGNVSMLDEIRESAPDKEIYFTEASIGTWSGDFETSFRKDMKNIFLGTLSRGCSGVTLWNLILDDENGPNRPKGCSTCFGAGTIMKNDYSYETLRKNSHWYDIMHCSVAVKPGAVRLETSGFNRTDITYLAFRNPDDSYGAIFLSNNDNDQMFVFDMETNQVKVTVPKKSVLSLKWKN